LNALAPAGTVSIGKVALANEIFDVFNLSESHLDAEYLKKCHK